jgi:hypothetical protein
MSNSSIVYGLRHTLPWYMPCAQRLTPARASVAHVPGSIILGQKQGELGADVAALGTLEDVLPIASRL